MRTYRKRKSLRGPTTAGVPASSRAMMSSLTLRKLPPGARCVYDIFLPYNLFSAFIQFHTPQMPKDVSPNFRPAGGSMYLDLLLLFAPTPTALSPPVTCRGFDFSPHPLSARPVFLRSGCHPEHFAQTEVPEKPIAYRCPHLRLTRALLNPRTHSVTKYYMTRFNI